MADGVVEFDVRANLDNLSSDMSSAQNVAEQGGNKLADIAGGVAKKIGAALAAVGIAEGVKKICGLADDLDKAMNSYSASTGTAIENTENYRKVLEGVYASNYGEDFQDIADAMGNVNKNLGEMSDEQLQNITESAFALRDTFEYGIAESTRAAKAMMENFGTSGEDAMSLIAAGAQNGLDYSGELIDSINEYSVQFAKLGLNADDMFNIFQAGADSGAWNLDKIGDAVKEFSIRAIDGSKSTAEGFATIGLNADEMAAKFTAGGDSAKAAFNETIKALSSMQDPVAQDAAGVQLFGTMWEDLGKNAVASLADITGAAYDTSGAMEQIKSVKYNDLGSMLEGLKRNLELVALPIGELLIPQTKKMIETILPIIQEYGPKVVDVIGKVITYGQELKAAVLDNVFAAFSELKEPFKEFISDLIPKLADLFLDIGKKIGNVASDILPKLIDGWKKVGGSVSELINRLLPKLAELFKKLIVPLSELISNVLPVIMDIGTRIYDMLSEVASTVLTALIDAIIVIADALLPIITDIIPKLIQLFLDIMPPILELIEQLLPVLAEWFAAVAEVVSGIIEAVLPILIELFKAIIPIISEIARVVLPAITDAFNVLKEPISDLIKSILPLLQQWLKDYIQPAVEALTPVIKILAAAFSETLKRAIEDITPIIEGVVNVLKGVISFITDVFKGDWEAAWQDIKGIALDAVNMLIQGIEKGINGAIGLINNLINGVNGLTDTVGIPAIPNIPEVDLPTFHIGGIIDFKGKYEAPIMAKDGEMVLTSMQQKRLFDIANGLIPTQNNNNISSSRTVNNYYYNTTMNATVRSDRDIEKLSEQLAMNKRQNEAGRGK